MNHDEHQFLAPAALLSREGLMPWRDYPLFHLPNLVFAYAAADRWTGDLILGAKMVCFGATALFIAGLVWAACRRSSWQGFALAAAAVGLLLTNPLFLYTAGKTWNHEVPAVLLVGAGAVLIAAAGKDQLWLTALAGILGGLSAGCRLTFAPALVGLALFVWLQPVPMRRRFLHLVVLTGAATLALGPSLFGLATHTEAFVFGNLEFPRLRLADPTNTRIQKTVSWWRKARYFIKEVVIPNWAVFVLWGAVAVQPGWQWIRRRMPENRGAGLWLVLFPFVLLGCFAPSRYQYQHFYVFVPLVLAASVGALASCTQVSRYKSLAIYAGMLVAVGLGVRSREEYAAVRNLGTREEWFSEKTRRVAEEVRGKMPEGRVLTLAPAFPLEGGLRIYPQFATGPFGWRSAGLVPEERRQKLHLVAPADLDALLKAEPPAGILTGVEEEEEEAPLIAWAERNGYVRVALKKKRAIWVPKRAGG